MYLSLNNCTFDAPVGDVQSHNIHGLKIIHNYHNDLHEFLTPLAPESRHIAVRDGHTKGTGEWLLRSAEFREWHEGTGARVLCCTGEPGIGKTYLACRVIEKLREDNDCVVCHVYCDYVDKERQTARNILGAILLRIIMHMDDENDVISQLRSRRERGISLSVEETISFVRQSVESGGFHSVRLCLDAVDELDPGELDKLLHSFSQLCDISTVYIFLTGRRNAGVESSINRMLADVTSIEYLPISTIETCPDMQLFLMQKLKDDRYSDLLDSDLRETIFERLAGTDSTFLLASLNVRTLLRQKTKSQRREALDAKELELNDAYEQMLERIKEQDPLYGMRILQWVLFSMRPLTLEELLYAVAIRPGVKDFNPVEDLPPSSIIDVTLGLVTVEKGVNHPGGREIVRFVHFTLKEHLLLKSSLHFPTGHSLLAEATLIYLSHQSITNEKYRYRLGGDLRPFYIYAVKHWGHHVRNGENEELVHNACNFLQSTNFQEIPIVDNSFVEYMLRGPLNPYSSPLHVAAYFGLSNALKLLFPCSADRESDLNTGPYTPLSYAALEGHLETVQLLLDYGTDLNADIESSLWTLDFAAREGRIEVVKLLLEQEPILAKLPKIGPIALESAAAAGHIDIVELLLERGDFSLNMGVRGGRTPLMSAASSGCVQIMKLFLGQNDIDVNSTDSSAMTALHHAALFGTIEALELLLEREDINLCATDVEGRTALMYAAWSHMVYCRAVGIARLLLEKGIDVNVTSRDGKSVLFYAAQSSDTEVVKLLLKQEDIDIDILDNDGRTVLSWAAQWGGAGIVHLLLERDDIDLNRADNLGYTPLIYAARQGRVEIVQLLLERETIDVGFVDNYGRTALSHAIGSGNMPTIQLLLARDDIDTSPTDNSGRTLLSYAANCLYRETSDELDIAELFLRWENIDINSADNNGRTALSYAAGSGTMGIIKLLLDREDVDVGVADINGRTALSYAAGSGRMGIIKLLLDREDVDVGVADINGRTALSYVAERGYLEVARLLLARDSPNDSLTDNHGRTLLSYAVTNPYDDVADMTKLFLQWKTFDVNSVDKDGRTALSYAANFGRIAAVELLLEQTGIDVGVVDSAGRTALSYAAERGNTEVFRLLLNHGDIDTSHVDDNGRTALSYALTCGNMEIARLLLARIETNMNHTDNNDRSLLSYASVRASRDIIKIFLEQDGVDVNSADEEGRTALSYAAENGNIGAAELLLKQQGIDVGLCDKAGLTALSYAEGRGEQLIAVLLHDREEANKSGDERG